MQKEIPILFSTDMVRAILDGRKTMTRRVVKPQPSPMATLVTPSTQWKGKDFAAKFPYDQEPVAYEVTNTYKSPYGKPGDLLWVRETWNHWGVPTYMPYVYAATDLRSCGHRWKPSIHMPKEAARIWLRVTDVRVERLQDISEQDAKAEGSDCGIYREGPNTERGQFHLELNHHAKYRDGFRYLIQSIEGRGIWDSNPWVWVVSFEVLSTTGKPAELCHN